MRGALREILIANVPMVNGEVWEPSAAGPELPKPHLVLREGVQDAGDAYADFTTAYEVWPYVERTTFKQVDTLSKEVIDALHRKRFDVSGVPHYIEYVGTVSDDIVDKEWDALTRGLRFQVFSLAWLLHNPTNPDPVEAMQLWSAKKFPLLQTNPVDWSPTDASPALYWRQSAIADVQTMNWGAWITATINGHVIAPDVSIRKSETENVVRKLAIDARTRMTDGSRMQFIKVSADSGHDPFRSGQVQLTVKFGILRDPQNNEFLKHVYFDEERGGVVHEED